LAQHCLDWWHLARRHRFCVAHLPLARLQRCGLDSHDQRVLPQHLRWRREHNEVKIERAIPIEPSSSASRAPHRRHGQAAMRWIPRGGQRKLSPTALASDRCAQLALTCNGRRPFPPGSSGLVTTAVGAPVVAGRAATATARVTPRDSAEAVGSILAPACPHTALPTKTNSTAFCESLWAVLLHRPRSNIVRRSLFPQSFATQIATQRLSMPRNTAG
jgi:hypothetical protein